MKLNRMGISTLSLLLLILLISFSELAAAPAEPFQAETAVKSLRSDADMLWLCLAAVLVFFMQAGFAYVEAGFTRAKNAVNILMKNTSDFLIGSLAFWFIGFSLMFGPLVFKDFGFGSMKFSDALLIDAQGKPIPFNFAFMLFQMVFAGTAATIVSGAMAERTKFKSYLIFTAICSGFVYPVFGSLAWSNLFDTS